MNYLPRNANNSPQNHDYSVQPLSIKIDQPSPDYVDHYTLKDFKAFSMKEPQHLMH